MFCEYFGNDFNSLFKIDIFVILMPDDYDDGDEDNDIDYEKYFLIFWKY